VLDTIVVKSLTRIVKGLRVVRQNLIFFRNSGFVFDFVLDFIDCFVWIDLECVLLVAVWFSHKDFHWVQIERRLIFNVTIVERLVWFV